MKYLIPIVLFATLMAACAPAPDVSYCQRYGEREGTAEYGRCLDYYHQQDGAFQRDLSFCSAQADITYPAALYDEGSRRTARVYGGAGWGRADWDGPDTLWIEEEPDYEHNALVDGLRSQIILPCMNQKGWQSAESWEMGRIEGKPRH